MPYSIELLKRRTVENRSTKKEVDHPCLVDAAIGTTTAFVLDPGHHQKLVQSVLEKRVGVFLSQKNSSLHLDLVHRKTAIATTESLNGEIERVFEGGRQSDHEEPQHSIMQRCKLECFEETMSLIVRDCLKDLVEDQREIKDNLNSMIKGGSGKENLQNKRQSDNYRSLEYLFFKKLFNAVAPN
jgi:hypothetical protein